jgi:hypothetical protein
VDTALTIPSPKVRTLDIKLKDDATMDTAVVPMLNTQP